MRADVHPEGAVLSTGTCLVPPAPFSLEAGDTVEIGIDEIGTLTTDVVRGLDAAVAANSGSASGASPPPVSGQPTWRGVAATWAGR